MTVSCLIEIWFNRRHDHGRVGRRNNLHRRFASRDQLINHFKKRAENFPLPARMEMSVNFVNQEDDLA